MRIRTPVTAAVLVFAHLFLHVGMGVGAGAPDLLTLGLLILAHESGMGLGALVGLGLGLLEDAQGLLAFGANGLSMALVGAAGAFTWDYFEGDSPLSVAIYLFVGKWIRDLLHWIAAGPANRSGAFGTLVVDAGMGALYMTAVGLALVFVVGVLRRPAAVQ